MLYSFTVPPDNDRGPQYTEAALDALHQATRGGAPITLELACVAGEVGLYVRTNSPMPAVTAELQDAYPGSRLKREDERLLDPPDSFRVQAASLHLTPDVLPIPTAADFEDRLARVLADPLAGVLSALRTGRNAALRPHVVLSLRAGRRLRYAQATRVASRLRRRFPLAVLARLHRAWCTHPKRSRRFLARCIALLARRDMTGDDVSERKLRRHLFEASLVVSVAAPADATQVATARLRDVVAAFGRFTSHEAWFTASPLRSRDIVRPGRGFLMGADEIATLWHPPVATVRVARMQRPALRELEPPVRLPSKETDADVTTLGRVQFRGQRDRFGIRQDDLRRHLFVCGRTGTGKSTLLRGMVSDAIEADRNVCLIDPHGDLVEGVLGRIPRRRTNDVVLFDAADRDYPVAFNPLHCPRPEQRPLVADAVLGSLRRLYGDSWGPRLEQILRNGVLALLENDGATLLTLTRLLTDTPFRSALTGRLADPVVRHFWQQTFAKWSPRFRTEAVSPVLNKLDGFLASPVARAITCRSRSTIDLRSILDNPRSILLCNFSKGLVGEETSSLLGAFLVSSLQTAALSRADLPEERRSDVQVYIDEFHAFVSDNNNSFATILSESRKYRVSFAALATQFLDQIDVATLAAVLGNCGSTVCFRCGVRDAETMALHLGGDLRPEDILSLPNFTAYARLLVGGEPTRSPFSMTTVVPSPPNKTHQRPDAVRRMSRQRYGRAASTVSREIAASLAA